MQLGAGAIARIDQPERTQPFKFRMIGVCPHGLRCLFLVPVKAEPVQIALERFNIVRPAPIRVQILNAQQHPPVPASHGKPGQQRGKHISKVHPAAGAGRKSSGQHIGHSLPRKNGRDSPAVWIIIDRSGGILHNTARTYRI